MSNHYTAQNVPYHALPLSNEERGPSPSRYGADPGELQPSAYHTPTLGPAELHPDDAHYSTNLDVPPGAQPRFLGAALYNEQGGYRDSYASTSQHSYSGSRSEYNGSLYALDPAGGYQDDPHASYQAGQYPMMPISPVERNRFLEEKQAAYVAPREKSKRKCILFSVIAGLLLLVIAVGVPVYLFVIRPKIATSTSSATTSTSKTAAASATPSSTKTGTLAVTGGDGSTVTTEDGSTFVYHNKFGGYWYYDENNPFQYGGRAQSWSPALNETFQYGTDQIRG